MSETTIRDRVWAVVIDTLILDYISMTATEVADAADVSQDTARTVLQIAEDLGLVTRETEQGQVYKPDVVAIDSDKYGRLF
jgi:response regulator of citrate/malate metabolism